MASDAEWFARMTAAEAEVSALRAALKAIDGMVLPGPIQRIARDALGRYPKEASDG